MEMTDAEFGQWLETVTSRLEQKQEALQKDFGLGGHSRWAFDQATQRLEFFDSDERLRVEADVVDIGSYSDKSSTWKWGWANSSLLPALRERAEKLKELEAFTGLALFTQDKAFKIEDESMAWELVAMAVEHLGALGCYRAPSSRPGGPKSYLVITQIRRKEI